MCVCKSLVFTEQYCHVVAPPSSQNSFAIAELLNATFGAWLATSSPSNIGECVTAHPEPCLLPCPGLCGRAVGGKVSHVYVYVYVHVHVHGHAHVYVRMCMYKRLCMCSCACACACAGDFTLFWTLMQRDQVSNKVDKFANLISKGVSPDAGTVVFPWLLRVCGGLCKVASSQHHPPPRSCGVSFVSLRILMDAPPSLWCCCMSVGFFVPLHILMDVLQPMMPPSCLLATWTRW